MSQYVWRQWGAESEFPASPIHAISQTSDGYLWIGTDKGLVRFDGFGFGTFPLPSNLADPNAPILGLTTDADGDLLIQPQGLGMLRRRHGQFEAIEMGQTARASPSQVTAMFRENDGGVLFADLVAGTLRFRNGRIQQLMPDATPVMALAESANGKIWMGTLNSGLVTIHEGKMAQVGPEFVHAKVNCLLPVANEEIWVGTDRGVERWDGGRFTHVRLPARFDNAQILRLLQDRDSNVWIGTARGLLRVNAKSAAPWNGMDAVGAVNALFEDREGNIWAGGTGGLERIRDSAFLTYSTAAGLPSDHTGPVYVDPQNRTWFAPIEGGVYVMKQGNVQPIRVAGLNQDVVYSITGGDHGSIWLGRQHGGITHLEFANGPMTERTYTEHDGLVQNSIYSIYQARDGTLWAGTLSGGASKLKDGRFTTYTSANGLAANTVAAILERHDGTVWFATPNGISVFSNSDWKTYKTADGLPSEDVNCLYEDSTGTVWIGTSRGLALFKGGRVQVPRNVPASLGEEIFGIAEDRKKGLWIATSRHVTQLQSEALAGDSLQPADIREFSMADGLFGMAGVKRNVSVTSDSAGKIWFSLNRGLSVVDPAHLADGLTPSISHIEAVQADGRAIDVGGDVRIPPSKRRVTVNFTGVSLAVPEHVRFRYILDGFDRKWSDPADAREAVYTNLAPGSYHFRVTASNSAGVWNGVETNLAFEVEPALWETWWFRVLVLGAIGFLGFLAYQMHLRKLTRQLNARFEERLAERTRIAQELHDTLLQGVLSASMQLHVASDRVETNSPARPLLNRVLELMGLVVEDGRNAIRGLRLSNDGSQDLDQAFCRLPQELAIQSQTDFRVIVEGSSRLLHPVIRDEVYRIIREAVANTFRHAGAKRTVVELEYGAHEFRVVVSDDGCGIDPQVLRSGREDHWGLSGMRERSEKIGAKLKVSSRIGGGTEVDLRVPARIAFSHHDSTKAGNWISRIYKRADTKADARSAKTGQH